MPRWPRGSCKVDGTALYAEDYTARRIYVTCGVWHGIYVTCKVDSTAEDYAKQRIYVTWGVARNLRKSSIVTSLQAESRAPDDGRMNFGAFPPKVQ